MDKKIGLQIAGSDPGFTIFFSADWEGEQLTHSSERKNSVEPVYYEACFGAEHWTYVAVYCNFLSSVNREESFKIGLRLPSRHELTDKDGDRVSPAHVLKRIYESVKTTALIRRGSDTYRLRPDAVFDAAEYAAILGEYTLRPVWGVAAESKENEPDVFMELRGYDPTEPLLHVPYLIASSEGARVCIGSFTDDIDKYLFSPVEMRAEPFVMVNVTGCDRLYEYVLAPGRTLLIRTSDCGFPDDEFDEESILLVCDTIIATCGQDIGSEPTQGVSYYANSEGGVVFVKFLPKPKPKDITCSSKLIVRIADDNKTVRPLRVKINESDGSVREIVCLKQTFVKDGADLSTTIDIVGLGTEKNIVVSLDSPSTAECIAFGDDNGAFVADFVRHGRRRSLPERFVEAMGLGSGSGMSGSWQIARWIVIIVIAALLILGGTLLAKLAGSMVGGALPFIDKII